MISTEKIEFVETHNIVKSLRRLRNAKPYYGGQWKRALYFSLVIDGALLPSELSTIRTVLGLP